MLNSFQKLTTSVVLVAGLTGIANAKSSQALKIPVSISKHACDIVKGSLMENSCQFIGGDGIVFNLTPDSRNCIASIKGRADRLDIGCNQLLANIQKMKNGQ